MTARVTDSAAPLQDLVVFDFDGTLTTEDTFVGFMRHYLGAGAWAMRMAGLMPVFARYKLGRVDRHAVKRAVVGAVFAGKPMREVEASARDYADTVIPTLVRPRGAERFAERVEAMRAGGPRVVVCSASIDPYLRHHFRNTPDVDIVACELATGPDGVCTGELSTYNVWGDNKVRALEDRYGAGRIRLVEAYGDTKGDAAMLAMAQTAHWRPFR